MATVQSIVDLARGVLIDIGATKRWSDANMLAFYNISKDMLVVLKRDLGAVTLDFTCVAGARQVLPAGSLGIVDVRRDMGTNGTTSGKAIRLVDMYDLDAANPDWMNLEPADVPGASLGALNWCTDKRNPLVFYLCPAPAVGRHVQVVHSKAPADAAALADTAAYEDLYRTPLADLIAARALMEDTTSGDASKAQWLIQRAEQFLGVNRGTQAENQPKPPAVAQQMEGA